MKEPNQRNQFVRSLKNIEINKVDNDNKVNTFEQFRFLVALFNYFTMWIVPSTSTYCAILHGGTLSQPCIDAVGARQQS